MTTLTKNKIAKNIRATGYVGRKRAKTTYSNLPAILCYFYRYDGFKTKAEIVEYIFNNQNELSKSYIEMIS